MGQTDAGGGQQAGVDVVQIDAGVVKRTGV